MHLSEGLYILVGELGGLQLATFKVTVAPRLSRFVVGNWIEIACQLRKRHAALTDVASLGPIPVLSAVRRELCVKFSTSDIISENQRG